MCVRRAYVLRVWIEPDAPAEDQTALRGTLQPAEGGTPRPFSSLEQLAALIRNDLAGAVRPTKEEW
jgi:hypothetical protein